MVCFQTKYIKYQDILKKSFQNIQIYEIYNRYDIVTFSDKYQQLSSLLHTYYFILHLDWEHQIYAVYAWVCA